MIREILIYLSAFIGIFAVTFYLLSFFSKKENEDRELKELPFVSIIIPAFNEEEGISGTLRSALDLDYPKDKIEIIVVDDGSKDKTYQKAAEFKKYGVGVFRLEKNSGKGAAINFGLKKAKGEIVVTMDADNTVPERDALKNAVVLFGDPDVMCIAPTIAIFKPKGMLQRVQQIEYMLGVFLRRAFSNLNAIHITPGAFSIYRKWFFDKYGGFKENNLTEDMEVALRIQYHNYKLKNSLNTGVYAVAPNTFVKLLKQRRRWYVGLLQNLWEYKTLFSKKYGAMGIIVLPVALITIVISTILTSWIFINALLLLKKEISFWESVNFGAFNNFEINKFLIEKSLVTVFTNPMAYFFILFVGVLIFYMLVAKKYVKKHTNIGLSILFFLGLYSFLFAFWWIVSSVYFLFRRKISWR